MISPLYSDDYNMHFNDNLNNMTENMEITLSLSTSFFVCLVESLLELVGGLAAFLLFGDVLGLKIVVIEVLIEVLVIVNPSSDHVGVLLVEVDAGGFSVEEHGLVVADMIGCKGLGSIEQHLTPKVGVLARLVHGGIGLEVALDVELVLFKHQVNLLLVLGVQDLVEIAAHTVLFIMETIVVGSSDCEAVLRHELSEHTPISYLASSCSTYL